MVRRNPSASRGRSAAFGAMLLALFFGVSDVARAQDLSCSTGDLEVRSLKFEGNRALSDDELALRVTTTPSSDFRRNLRIPLGAKRCLNRVYLQRDIAAIEVSYQERGYYSAKADTVITRLSGGAVSVTFRVVEGPVTVLDSLKLSGLNGIPDSADIVRSLRTRQGMPFSYTLYFADLDSITKRLRNLGYYRATTVKAFGRDSLNAAAEIIVVPGPRMRFGTSILNVTPLADRTQQVPDNIVRRIMGISPGTLYSDRSITEAQRSLFQLGVYRHVEVAPLPDSLQPPGDSVIVLDVRLTEDFMKRLDTEYGWGSLDCGRFRAQYSNLNFLRSGRRFEVTGQASKIGYGLPLANNASRDVCTWLAGVSSAGVAGQNALASDSAFSSDLHYYGGLSFRQPRLVGTRWVPTLSIYSERRGEYKAYLRTTKVGADASALRDIGLRSQLRLGYTREFGQTDAPDALLCALFSRCDDSSRVDIKKLATLGVASASVTRLRTDNLVSPTRGTIVRSEYRTSASRVLGTDSSLFFHKGSVEAAIYAPFVGANVLSLRVRAGAVAGSRGSFIPPQERLYAGGANSIRGFQQNELGDVVYIARAGDVTKDTASTPIIYQVSDTSGFERVVPLGGNRLVVANLEYRVPDAFILPNFLQYTLFVDAGDVWNSGAKPTFKLTPGLGLRLLTAIGPIQVNFGYNQYARPHGPIYFEDPARVAPGAVRPDISPLYCVTPGNNIPLGIRDGVVQPPLAPVSCPATYAPVQRKRWYEKMSITLSLGPDF